MSEKLKLGWTVSEVIGVAIVNPRAVSGMKAVPRQFFQNENGSIEIRRWSVEIKGSVESAALAFAEDILRTKNPNGETNNWNYMNVIAVIYQNGAYAINLTPSGLGLFDPNVWPTFKKNVEKICNNLTVFI